MKHGDRSTYTNRKCRCRRCKKANADYFKRRRKNRAKPKISKAVA